WSSFPCTGFETYPWQDASNVVDAGVHAPSLRFGLPGASASFKQGFWSDTMHSDVVHRTWSGLDGRLIFDFTIRRDSDGDRPSSATVYCRGQMNDARVVSI